MDVHSKEQRHYNMSRIRSKDTKPELLVRIFLWNNGYRYRLHKKGLPGKPDIILSKYKLAIYVNGCFWHMHNCSKFRLPGTNTEFWKEKLEGNKKRDIENYKKLHQLGWRYRTIWECQLHDKSQNILNKLLYFLRSLDK